MSTTAYVECPLVPGVPVVANRCGKGQKSNEYRCTKCGQKGHKVLRCA